MAFQFLFGTAQRVAAYNQHLFEVVLVLLRWAMALVVNKISNHWDFPIAFTNLNVYEIKTENWFDVESTFCGDSKISRFSIDLFDDE